MKLNKHMQMAASFSERRGWSALTRSVLFVSALAICACGGGGEPDSSGGAFDTLTLTSSNGYVLASPEGDCNVVVDGSTFELNGATHELSWDTCEWTAQQEVKHSVGSRLLDDEAFATIQNAYAMVKPSEHPQCVLDGGDVKLEVLKDGQRQLFVDETTSACGGMSEGVAVSGLPELRAAMIAAR